MPTGCSGTAQRTPVLLRAGETCPHCGMARLVLTPDQEVVCLLCGLRSGSPCT